MTTQPQVINIGQTVVLSAKNRLAEFRTQVIEQGNAKLLDQYDQLVNSIDKLDANRPTSIFQMILGILILLALVIPWGYGLYKFFF